MGKWSVERSAASDRLGGPQLVDLGAEVLHDEVLFRRGRALVDLLRPLFERNLDAEFLVDREDDVEEVERIDAEVVDRVALGGDLVAVDLAGLGDDVGDPVEG